MHRKLVIISLLALAICTAATAQQDDAPVKAAIDAMAEALSGGDLEAVGALISDSGFVALVPGDEGTECLDKDALLEGFQGQGAGMNVEFTDTEVELYWMVATATTKISVVDMGVELTMKSALMREGGEWKFVVLTALIPDPQTDEEAAGAVLEQVGTLPTSMQENDLDLLAEAIHDESFILAYVDPGYEVRWTNSKEQLVQMLDQVTAMVTINETSYEPSETIMSQDVAVVHGTWMLDITDLGETKSDMTGFAVRTDDGWKIVAFAGGPQD